MPPKDEVVEAIRSLIEVLNERHGENISRLDVTDRKIEEVIRRVDSLHDAFPNGDIVRHHDYHESLIKKNDASTEFYQKLRIELASKGLWALIGILFLALGSYIKTKVMG